MGCGLDTFCPRVLRIMARQKILVHPLFSGG
jgi:hypothetical protein